MTFKICTLGCKVNTYESNVMRDILVNHKYEEVSDDKEADVVIINTCSVTNTADNKSLKMIRHSVNNNPNAIVIVTGCMSQVSSDKLKDIEGISIILGNYGKSKITTYINAYKDLKEQIIDIKHIDRVKFESMCLNNFNKTRAFVKIEDGCENFCSYCIIPYTRGKVRSKKKEDVLKEVKLLVNDGHEEIVLTGIHTGHYGADLDKYDLSDLLNDLKEIDGLKRIRISSIEITELDDKFIRTLKNNKLIVDHLHIPIQSGCDKTLKAMNRKYDVEYFVDKIERIRKIRPDISISTDVIVGFPGETEEDFKETMETVKKIEFTKIHVFPFSLRRGTKAEEMEGHLSETVKKQRVKKLMEISKELEIKYMEKFIGKEVTFIKETKKNGYNIGHTGNYLLIKSKKNIDDKDITTVIKGVEYPYCIDE